jgi:hypothetical protein
VEKNKTLFGGIKQMIPVKASEIIAFNRNIVEDIKIELEAQGHSLTGATINSITPSISYDNGTIALEAYGLSVIIFLDKGVSAANIPFSGAKGKGGGTSAYIQGLTRYAMLRFGLDEKKALGVAFAIATKHKREGMPTKASYQYSETGERLNAVEIVFKENKDKYDHELGDAVDTMITEVFNQTVSEEV